MRLLHEVIDDVCNIPDIPDSLKEQLLRIRKNNLPYCPPESVGVWWKECQIIINSFMPSKPEELVFWQKTFLTIWTGKKW